MRVKPKHLACCAAVRPSRSTSAGFAPNNKSFCTVLVCPLRAASINAVLPALLLAFTGTPRLTRLSTSSTQPARAASRIEFSRTILLSRLAAEGADWLSFAMLSECTLPAQPQPAFVHAPARQRVRAGLGECWYCLKRINEPDGHSYVIKKIKAFFTAIASDARARAALQAAGKDLPPLQAHAQTRGVSAGQTLGILCITLATTCQADRDGMQGFFLQSIAGLFTRLQRLTRKTTQQAARARLTKDCVRCAEGPWTFSFDLKQTTPLRNCASGCVY